ncbi:hypothetical protein DPMN_156689 [Dreissena polymorpha]|uniref:Uncharacterized protein n=1 Tax=Dreissena polymorpha TaxID=45954 RepID=A0A9D4FU04_DREPO|nr:hypothetical protein DPMN_156689 [Dreissena polymorpha]
MTLWDFRDDKIDKAIDDAINSRLSHKGRAGSLWEGHRGLITSKIIRRNKAMATEIYN